MLKNKKGFIDIVDVVSIILIVSFLIGFLLLFGFYDSWKDVFGDSDDEQIESLKIKSEGMSNIAFLQASFDEETKIADLIVESVVKNNFTDFENFVVEEFGGSNTYWYFAIYEGGAVKPLEVINRDEWVTKGIASYSEYFLPTFDEDLIRIKMNLAEGEKFYESDYVTYYG